MSLNYSGLKNRIIIPTIQALGMFDDNAVNLLLGTCAIETDLGTYRKQINGPALGIYSMEDPTYRDCWRYIYLHENILERVLALCPKASHETFELIENDDRLATIMARIKYWMVPAPIPKSVPDLASYWKMWYNTDQGKGRIADFILKYTQYVTSPL